MSWRNFLGVVLALTAAVFGSGVAARAGEEADLAALDLPVSPTAAQIAKNNGLPFTRSEVIILKHDQRRGFATVLANGRVALGNSGDETSVTLMDPGLFRAEHKGGVWSVAEPIDLGRHRIAAHQMKIELQPGTGLLVSDTITATVEQNDGFALGLNHTAQISMVEVDDQPAKFIFSHGLLWIDALPGERRIHIDYQLPVEPTASTNSGVFFADHGHLRNQYWWHPMLGLTEERSRARFDISVKAPAGLPVAIDKAPPPVSPVGTMTFRFAGDDRAIALSLAYDAAWEPRRFVAGEFTLDLVASRDFTPDDASIANTFRQTTDTLAARFGLPRKRQVTIVQNRARERSDWAFLSNAAIHAGPSGGAFDYPDEYPVRAPFAHEVAHLWTNARGPLRYFLTEGWATYAEAAVLESRYGQVAAEKFWADRRRLLSEQPDLLDIPLDQDRSNSGVSYHKGALALRQLEVALGRRAFDTALSGFIALEPEVQNYPAFLKNFGNRESEAERILEPWVSLPGLPTDEP